MMSVLFSSQRSKRYRLNVVVRFIGRHFITAAILANAFSTHIAQAGAFSYIKSIAIGDLTICALTDDGVKCWGHDAILRDVPGNLVNPRAIAAGTRHACAITDTEVRCWGYNDACQQCVPDDLVKPRAIAASGNVTCVLADGGIRCWGDGHYVPPSNLQNPRTIAGRDGTFCALSDLSVACWDSSEGGHTAPWWTPDDLLHPRIAAVGGRNICALTETGVRCWGWDYNLCQTCVPEDLQNPRDLTVGGSAACAMTDAGIRCWEHREHRRPPIPEDLQNPQKLVAGPSATCALTNLGIRCWEVDGSPIDYVPNLPLATKLSKAMDAISRHVASEKKAFLSTLAGTVTSDLEEAFLFWAIAPLLHGLDSDWALDEVRPDLQWVRARYERIAHASSLVGFERSDINLRIAFRIIATALVSIRPMLSSENQRSISNQLVPALADKLASNHLDANDGGDIAQSVASTPLLFAEIHQIPTVAAFGALLSGIVAWLGE